MDDRATIAIVGASARSAAFSAMRAGYRVVTADLFADADLQRACPATRISPYPEGLPDWLTKCACDGWMYTGALENHPALVDAIAAEHRLLGTSGKTLRKIRSPLALAAALGEAGLLFPETRPYRNDLPSDGQWLAKTYQASSGAGVQELAESSDGNFVQRRVPGIALSAVYVGGTLLGVSQQLVGESWTGAKEFQYCGSIAPWPVSTTVGRQLRRLGAVLSTTFELEGLVGVDLMLDAEDLWTIEVNPRYTASVEVVERAHGVNALADHFSAYQMTKATSRSPVPSEGPFVGKAILYAKSAAVITPEQTAWLLEEAGDPWCPQIADIPTSETRLEPGDPVSTVFATGETSEAVTHELKRRVRRLEQRLF